jgi:Na+/H+ antiporter NhaD/arsenite permease-like protein
MDVGEEEEALKVPAALSKIDVSGILFFFGILLSIGALDSAGILTSLATTLQNTLPSEQIIAAVIGVASAVIDNVPLVSQSALTLVASATSLMNCGCMSHGEQPQRDESHVVVLCWAGGGHHGDVRSANYATGTTAPQN